MPIATGVCEACAERGRPNQPVYKIGLCEFCYHGLPHPNAPLEQLTREKIGVYGEAVARATFNQPSVHTSMSRPHSETARGRTREGLMSLRADLAERELFLTNLRAELSAFEGLYLRRVGILYAELDECNARIAEHVATAEGTEEARSGAALARAQADESFAAVHSAAATSPKLVSPVERKTVSREAIGRIHHELITDKEGCDNRERQIAETNDTYQRSDADALRRVLDTSASLPGFVRETDIAPDFVRCHLQVGQVMCGLSDIEIEIAILNNFDIAKLRSRVQAANADGRDLLSELARDLTSRIELLASLCETPSPENKKAITVGIKSPTAIVPRKFGTLNRNGSAVLAARGLMDLRIQEGEDWRRRGLLLQVESGYEEAACGFRSGFELHTSHAASQLSLGPARLRGLIAPRDYCQAATTFRKAAEQGHWYAANSLGILYEHGLGVPQDFAQAFAWYFKAAGQGVAIAQFNLDNLYKGGRGLALGYAQAAKHWYRAAAGNCDVTDKRRLGLMYASGKGVSPDDVEAAYWFRNAAQQGDAIAQESLGLMYALGKGVPKDRAEAEYWCGKAAQQGSNPALQALKALSRKRPARSTKITRSPSRIPLSAPGPSASNQVGASATELRAGRCLALGKDRHASRAKKLLKIEQAACAVTCSDFHNCVEGGLEILIRDANAPFLPSWRI